MEQNNDEINGDIEYLYDDIYCITSKYFENNQEKVIKHDHEKFCKNNYEKLKNLSSQEYCLFEKMQYIECNDNKEIYNYIKLVNEIIRLIVKYIIKKDDKQLKLINNLCKDFIFFEENVLQFDLYDEVKDLDEKSKIKIALDPFIKIIVKEIITRI